MPDTARLDPVFADPARRRLMDLLRAYGILQVVLFHVLHGLSRFAPPEDLPAIMERLPRALNFAWQPDGPDVIFVVSALLLGVSLIEERLATGRISWRDYLVKRVSRIVPLYWLAVALFALGQGDGLREVLLSAFFLGYTLGDSSVVPVGWSMEVILLAYLALPLAVEGLFRLRRPGLWLVLAFAASGLVRYGYLAVSGDSVARLLPDLIATQEPTRAAFELYFRPWFRLSPFIAGLAVAWWLVMRPGWITRLEQSRGARITLALAALPILWLAWGLPIHDERSWVYAWGSERFWALYWCFTIPLTSIGVGLLALSGLTAPGGSLGARVPGPWGAVSRTIFPIYLFHMFFLLIAAVVVFRSTESEALGQANLWLVLGTFGLTAALSLGFGLLLNRFFEAPIQAKLRARFAN